MKKNVWNQTRLLYESLVLRVIFLTVNGRFARVSGEHGRQPEMTFANVLSTRNPTLEEPFKISFETVLPLGGEKVWQRSLPVSSHELA